MKANPIFKKAWAPTVAVVWNLLLAFAVYFIARAAYLLENLGMFRADWSWSQAWQWVRGGYMFDRSAITYTNALWIVMLLLPVYAKETRTWHRICKWIFVAINALALAVNLADAVYFPYTLRRTTTSVFQEFSHDSNLGGIFLHEFIAHWYLVLLFVIVTWALAKLYLKPQVLRHELATHRSRTAYTLATLLSLAAAVPLAIGACRGGLGHGIRPITINNANQYTSRPVECAVVLNTPFALLRTIGKSVFETPSYFASQTELESVYTPVHEGDSTRQMKRRNVVVIIVESFGREYIGALNRDLEGRKYKGYTPCVDSIIARSLTFEHSFCNGRKSIDAMPSVLCGLPMFVEPFVLTPASMNNYTSLAGLLAQEGYATAFFHGANRGSMGFMAFANKVGFQQYYGREDYASDPRFGGDADFDGHWGIWDEPFLQYFATKMNDLSEPFMTAVFTASSHHPFVIPEQYKQTYPEEHLPIHKCIRYTDMSIGRFFATASRQPWFKNTLFVLTSDHTNQSDHAEYQSDIGLFRAPFIIFDPSGELPTGVENKIAQQTDVVPTVLGLLNYPKDYLAFGCDLIETPAEETFAVSWLNGNYLYAKHGRVIRFDGQKTTATYALTDRLMKNPLPTDSVSLAMERELRAIIQQYMTRMNTDRLTP